MTKRITAADFAAEILAHDDILILIHSHPDGDTAGTGVALLNALSACGKNAAVACTDELADHLSFISDYADSKNCFFGASFEDAFTPSYIVSVDIASTFLVGKSLSEYADNISLALDHHDTNTLECPKLFVEETSSSAGETLYFVILEMEKLSGKKLIDKNTACAIYSAIASDSGNFKFSNVSGRTMMTAGKLIDAGAENAEISRRLFDIRSFGTYIAEALCTKNTQFFCDGKIAFSHITYAEMEEKGIIGDELDTCVQLLRTIKGVETAVFAKEKTGEDGQIKFRLSMRSNEYVDVAAICAAFDGGGHKKAAGCTVFGEIADVTEKIVKVISEKL